MNPTGGLKSSIEISITERKVEGKEIVTTPAGTWECYDRYRQKIKLYQRSLALDFQ